MSDSVANSSIIELGRVERLLLDSEDRLAALASADFVDLAIAELRWEGLDESELRVLSLDVFDTMLLRDESCELRRFWDIAHAQTKVLPGFDPRDLLIARLTATRACYRTSLSKDGYREGEIEDIYRTSLQILGVTDDLASAMVAQELEYESEHLIPNPAIEPLIRTLGVSDIVAVTNMYLRGSHVGELLKASGGVIPSDIYSSTDLKMSKNDSKLLLSIGTLLDLPANAFLHIGDSYVSDFRPAKRAGWLAQLWPVPLSTQKRRRDDAVACVEELESQGVVLGSLATHFVEHP